ARLGIRQGRRRVCEVAQGAIGLKRGKRLAVGTRALLRGGPLKALPDDPLGPVACRAEADVRGGGDRRSGRRELREQPLRPEVDAPDALQERVPPQGITPLSSAAPIPAPLARV